MAGSYKGLSASEVEERIAGGKVNTSSGSISKSRGEIFRTHLLTYFNFLNLFLGALILTTGQLKNLLFLGTIICNSFIGIVQELRVKSLVDKLSVITASKVRVMRDGKESEIGIDQLVMDDIMLLESGDQIGADCVVLDSQGTEVNESMITGESVAVKKKAGDQMLSGSFLTAGSCTARVVHVGSENYATILAAKAKNKKRAASEMQKSINRIIKAVGFIIIPVGIMLYLSQRAVPGTSGSDAIVNTVGGVIGMIPEGLVLLTSVSFIVGVGKLAMKHALVQEIEAIESLARVNVLCLDKTGTITTGELEVEKFIPLSGADEKELSHVMSELVYAFADVNPTQKALMEYFPKTGEWKADQLIPFSSKRKLRAISFEGHGGWVLGAPEFIMGSDENLMDQCASYAREGYRVLLLASTDSVDEETSSFGPVTAKALLVISDRIREEAAHTFAYFRSQHVDIKVISGDNPATVSKIACKAGLEGAQDYVDAQTLPQDPDQLAEQVGRYTVFGRVTPEQKQSLIKAYQSGGSVVGMVGDGVNDVLALKDADCGIAMAAGSDAARQVAHIVLLDSDFVHLKDIVKEGRSIISNIERVSSLYLTKTIYSILLSIIFIIFAREYPFQPVHLTLVSAIAIGIPSFFLALEPNDSVTSGGFLRHVLRTALPGALAMVVSVLVVQAASSWLNLGSALTSTYNLLLLGIVSLLVLVMVSSPMNLFRKIICIVMTAIFAASVAILPGLFNIDRIFEWKMIFILPVGIITYLCMRFFKWFFRSIFPDKPRKITGLGPDGGKDPGRGRKRKSVFPFARS